MKKIFKSVQDKIKLKENIEKIFQRLDLYSFDEFQRLNKKNQAKIMFREEIWERLLKLKIVRETN